MNATASLQVRPDIGGILHIIFSPGNPLHATMTPAPMLENSHGKPVRIDIERARLEHPEHYVVSYDPKDGTSTILPLLSGFAWYVPKPFQQHLIHAAITRALAPKPPQEGISP